MRRLPSWTMRWLPFCLKTSGSSSGVGGGSGLGTEEFVFGRGWSGDRFGGAAWGAAAAQLLLLPAGSTVRLRSVIALADGRAADALPMVWFIMCLADLRTQLSKIL